MGFEEDVKTAAEYAKNEADKVDGGDPATHVTADVDGRSGFVSKFKKHGEETRTGWKIGPAKVGDDYGFTLSVLEGTDIQLHKKKLRSYRAFEEKMNDLGWKCDIDISTYSR